MPAPPALRPDNCLFVDLDGTLLDLRDDPAGIRADEPLLALLKRCAQQLDGALAIVSGRPVAELDECLAPLRLPCAGIHGLERRGALGSTAAIPVDRASLRLLVQPLSSAVAQLPGALLEDKGDALALHWRCAPRHAAELMRLAAAARDTLGPGWQLLEGNQVVEVLPLAANKGSAVRAYMQEMPFRGRIPVFIGDDLTDLPGFAGVREFGGHGIAVGERITGDYRLDGVAAVRSWLGGTGG